jgi:hypothetical protein
MALAIYYATDGVSKFSQDGAFTNPLQEVIDGRTGGSVERLLYIRNDNSLFSYLDIKLVPEDTDGVSIVDGSLGFAWKLSAGDAQPTDEAWGIITAGEEIELADLGTVSVSDTSTYLPFWLRIEAPRNVSVKTYVDVQLKITAERVLV